jgi:hypothetical protein
MSDTDDDDGVFGLGRALSTLPSVLREPARAEFWEALLAGEGRLVGKLTFHHGRTGRAKVAARYLMIGDVFWFDAYALKDCEGRLALAIASVSLDDPPCVASLRSLGGYSGF